ncbi:MAG: hypothetical protein KH321_04270 [Clostridium sp.]|jgi:hypothetical protein|nr:hypothetical protein [Clostridium sp.]
MLQDILNTSHDVIVEGKKYQFEFDHSAYAAFEQQSHKSIFEIYDRLLTTNNISYMDSLMIVSAGLLKYHSTDEICSFQDLLRKQPGIWNSIKEQVTAAFIVPLLPPEILRNVKKKVPVKKQKKSKK